MVQFLSPLQTNSELQWDSDSLQKPYNCGPSSAEKVANFFRNLYFYGIERTRKLGSSRVNTGTNATEQKRMLDARGVPSSVLSLRPSEVKEKLRSGRRPLILWLRMSYIPDNIAGHSFQLDHAVAALANGVVNGVPGIWVNEPNQKRGSSTYKRSRFYPDRYWIPAAAAVGRWCIVPDKAKVITTRTALKKKWIVNTASLNIRSGPSAGTTDVGTFHRGDTFYSNLLETQGGKYVYSGVTHDEWLGFVKDGKQRWVAKAYCKEA